MDDDGNPFRIGPRSALPPAVRAFRTVLLLGQQLRTRMDGLLRPAGVTTQQAALVTAVIGLDRPSLAEAASALGTSRQNVTQLVNALVRKGLLSTGPDPADRRRTVLRATEQNAAFWADRDATDFAAVADWFDVLEPAELESLCDLAERVLTRLESAESSS